MMADQVAHLAHLNARDTTYARVSRAPQPDIERLKARMGWDAPWYTLTDSFDTDMGVDEWHGTNAFIREGDKVLDRPLAGKPGREGGRRRGARAPLGRRGDVMVIARGL
jgi:hypothetical protein